MGWLCMKESMEQYALLSRSDIAMHDDSGHFSGLDPFPGLDHKKTFTVLSSGSLHIVVLDHC